MTDKSLVIDVQSLTKSFYGKKVVDQVSLQVNQGEIYGFLGPNGSGKTTTIRLICGLLTPDEGEGHCLGFDIKTQSEAIKARVGYMTQKFSLYEDLSVEENLQFMARLHAVPNRQERVAESLARLGMGKGRYRQLAGTLSGGWKQRLALAAATIHRPQLLLLDEPTAGVDPKARRDFWDEIHRLSGDDGVTTLVSTHYMDEAERCHRLAYIAYGHLLTSGGLDEVIAQSGLFTWQITGSEISPLALALQQEPAVEQVAAFGRTLHVSSLDREAMQAVIQRYDQAEYQWREVSPTLEDVFIHFMQTEEDNFA